MLPGLQTHKLAFSKKETCKLDPVGSTVRYEMMELCTGSEKDKIVGTWWYWVSKTRYWLIHDGTGSVWGSTCWYMVAMDQYKAVMVDP